MQITLNHVSELLNVSYRIVRRRVSAASLEPIRREQRIAYYESSAVIPVALGTKDDQDGRLDLSQERAALARAQRQLCDLKIAEQEKRLLPADEVEDFIGSVVSANRQRMMALPYRVAIAVEGLETISEIEKATRTLVYGLMEEFAEAFSDH